MIKELSKTMIDCGDVENWRTEWSLWSEIPHSYEPFDKLFDHLSSRIEGDEFILDIRSPGGSIEVGDMIIRYLKATLAEVTVRVSYPCYSMGSMIALQGDKLEMMEDTFLMFHDFSHGFMPQKNNEIEQQMQAQNPYIKNKMVKWCSPFLTKSETKKMLSGVDLYIKWDDKNIEQRKTRHFK